MAPKFTVATPRARGSSRATMDVMESCQACMDRPRAVRLACGHATFAAGGEGHRDALPSGWRKVGRVAQASERRCGGGGGGAQGAAPIKAQPRKAL
eukprot:scaffold70781_cov73-Phaeocystis_antarctica.AAC.2